MEGLFNDDVADVICDNVAADSDDDISLDRVGLCELVETLVSSTPH